MRNGMPNPEPIQIQGVALAGIHIPDDSPHGQAVERPHDVLRRMNTEIMDRARTHTNGSPTNPG
jgi:hypothetical protein